MRQPVNVRLEIVIQSITYGKFTYDARNVKMIFAFADFPKIVIEPRHETLDGCGKSCELELKRIAFATNLPLWFSLVLQHEDFTEEIASTQYELLPLRGNLAKPAISVPFTLFVMHTKAGIRVEVQVRLVQCPDSCPQIFLATFGSSVSSSPEPALRFVDPVPISESAPSQAVTPERRESGRRVKGSPIRSKSPDIKRWTATVDTENVINNGFEKARVGGKFRTRGLKIKLNR
jgi:hypothetical protein